jgi:hypothetical protein
LVGATASPAADWSQNLVTILSPGTPFTIGTSNGKGYTLRNINLLTTSPGAVLSLIGGNVAFYGCSIISSGQGAVTSSIGVALFANCYIEGTDKIFYNYPTIYVYKSTIVPFSPAQTSSTTKVETPTAYFIIPPLSSTHASYSESKEAP